LSPAVVLFSLAQTIPSYCPLNIIICCLVFQGWLG
jgi:hypothetical protein